jgi:hypothetical protein
VYTYIYCQPAPHSGDFYGFDVGKKYEKEHEKKGGKFARKSKIEERKCETIEVQRAP